MTTKLRGWFPIFCSEIIKSSDLDWDYAQNLLQKLLKKRKSEEPKTKKNKRRKSRPKSDSEEETTLSSEEGSNSSHSVNTSSVSSFEQEEQDTLEDRRSEEEVEENLETNELDFLSLVTKDDKKQENEHLEKEKNENLKKEENEHLEKEEDEPLEREDENLEREDGEDLEKSVDLEREDGENLEKSVDLGKEELDLKRTEEPEENKLAEDITSTVNESKKEKNSANKKTVKQKKIDKAKPLKQEESLFEELKVKLADWIKKQNISLLALSEVTNEAKRIAKDLGIIYVQKKINRIWFNEFYSLYPSLRPTRRTLRSATVLVKEVNPNSLPPIEQGSSNSSESISSPQSNIRMQSPFNQEGAPNFQSASLEEVKLWFLEQKVVEWIKNNQEQGNRPRKNEILSTTEELRNAYFSVIPPERINKTWLDEFLNKYRASVKSKTK